MSFEPAPDVWIHGTLPLPGSRISEESLLSLLKLPAVTAVDRQRVSLASWIEIATEGVGLTTAQAAACMRLGFVLSQSPGATPQPMPPDDSLHLPLGHLLLLLWVQWAHHELGESCATNVQRAQAASGEVWPSLQMPPAAAASSVVVDRGPQLSSRTLAIQSRLHSSTQLTRRRRKLLQSSMSALLQLAGAGAERLYASEVDLLSLVIRPDRPTSSRLVSLGLRPTSIAAALGCFPASATLTKPAAALPLASILPAVRSALIEVAPTPSSSSSAAAAVAAQPHAPKPSSPLAGPPSAAAAGSQASPTGSGAAAAAAPELTVSTSDVEERDQPGGAVLGTLTLDAPDSTPHVPGGAVVRLLGAKRRTVVLRPAELRGGALQIMDCHNCHIYALAPVRSAEVLGCTRCTIVVGAAASALSVAHAAHVRLYATAKAAQLANCRDTTAYLCVNSPPLLVGANRRLVLAPFATAYDGHRPHGRGRRVPLLSHNWGAPVAVAPPPPAAAAAATATADAAGATAASADATSAGWSLLPPARFLPFHIPMDIPPAAAHGEGVAPPCELPREYSNALLSQIQRLGRFRDELLNLTCTEEARREVQAVVQASFSEWLQRTGNARQLTDLMAQTTW